MKNTKYIFLLMILILLVACKAKDLDSITIEEDPAIVEETIADDSLTQEEQDEILKEYYDLIKSKSDGIIIFVDENISKLDTVNVDQIIITLEDYLKLKNLTIREIINNLNKYYDYSSDEIRSYLEILNQEIQNTFTNGEEIKISLDELLERARITERHLNKYINGITYNNVYDLYENYIIACILGSGNQFIYANVGNSTIREDVFNKYKAFIEKNKEMLTSVILSRYLDELNLDEMDMNGINVLIFYDNLRSTIKYTIKYNL